MSNQDPRNPLDDAHDEFEKAYHDAAQRIIELANRLSDADQPEHTGDIADGLLAGAIHFWLYSRQPCDDPFCESCAPYADPEKRLQELLTLTRTLAQDSEYHDNFDAGPVGHA